MFAIGLLSTIPAKSWGADSAECRTQKKFTAIVHGGAGAWDLPADEAKPYRDFITKTLKQVHDQLKNGRSAVDVVVMALSRLEDSPLFNAGRGAIANRDGEHELDASLMAGDSLQAGAVAAVKTVKNPIQLAQAVMQQSEHVLLVATGAETFARNHGFKAVKPQYFQVKNKKAYHRSPVAADKKYGTVGAAIWDRCGNLAAGTSTGGYRTKLPGRVGDSPIIGAGTYADNRSAAVSATGHGEYFIRYAVTHDISARMRYQKLSLAQAADTVIHKVLKKAGGSGGIVAVDYQGKPHAAFNSKAMLHGWIDHSGQAVVKFK
jgi:beta-aspartyl-peptidase (threonine type)